MCANALCRTVLFQNFKLIFYFSFFQNSKTKIDTKKASISFDSKEALDISSEIWYDAHSSFSQRPSLEENALQQITHPKSSVNISEILANEQSEIYSSEQRKHLDKIDILEHKNINVQSIDVFGNLKDFKDEKQSDSAKIDLLLNKQKDVTEIVTANAIQDFEIEKSIEQFVIPDLITSKSVTKDENVFLNSENDLILEKPAQPTLAQKELHLEDNAVSIHQTTLAEKEDLPVEKEQPRKKKLRINIKPKQSVKVRQVLTSEKELKLKESKVKDDSANQSILEQTSLNIFESDLLEKESIKLTDKPVKDTAIKTQDHHQALTVKQVTSNQDIEQLEISAQNIQTISLGK